LLLEEAMMRTESLVLMVLLSSFLLPGCGGKGRPEGAVEMIQRLGGKVQLDDNLPKKPVVMVDLRNTAVSDDDLKCLKELSQLQILVLDSTGVTDAGLEPIKECSQLQRVFLRNTRVTADGAKGLRKTFPKAEIVN
jgi:hypothetical protein